MIDLLSSSATIDTHSVKSALEIQRSYQCKGRIYKINFFSYLLTLRLPHSEVGSLPLLFSLDLGVLIVPIL
jgi:hypothetical protein